MMNLKHILSAVMIAAGTAAIAAAPAPVGTVPPALASEIAAALKMKEHTAKSIAAAPAKALRQLEFLKGKDGQATALLGICYKDGCGVVKAPVKAREAFLAAAKLGNPVGQFWAGLFLMQGIGGNTDMVKGVSFMESAARKGVVNAMLVLSNVYLEGYEANGKLVIPSDHAQALRFLRQAAAKNGRAAMMLGDYYFKNASVKNDLKEAEKWYKSAKGVPCAEAALAEIDYESAAKQSAKDSAFKDLKELADAGNARAQIYAGKVMLAKGDNAGASKYAEAAVKQNVPAAFTLRADIARKAKKNNWLDLMQKAAAMNEPEAMGKAGYALVLSRNAKGVEMLKRAARRGDLNAQVKLARLTLEGRMVAKDVKKAFAAFQNAAAKGNVEAAYCMAVCYDKALGTAADSAKAAEFARTAAEAGFADAQEFYASFLRDGKGVKRDAKKAVEFFEKAVNNGNKGAVADLAQLISTSPDLKPAELKGSLALVQKFAGSGDSVAAFALGKMYTEGVKLSRNFALGRKNLEFAAKSKDGAAFAALADYYFNGWGVSKDYKKAHQLLAEGKKYNSGLAAVKIGIARLNGVGVSKDPRAALREFEFGFKKGCADGALWLGICHAKGIGVAVNAKTACKYYQEAAKKGSSAGFLMLGLCCRDGIGTERAPELAIKYLQEAITLGNSDAMYEMGLLYSNGTLVKKDIATAISWFKRAADSGNTYGIYELGSCYENGRGVKKDVVKAASLYLSAANAGNRYAQFMIGRCYEGGIGVAKDEYAAVKWYKKSAAGPDGFKYGAQRAAALEKKFKNIIR